MAQKSFPWTNNGTGDGTSGGYTALEWSELWRKLFLGGNHATQGVLRGVDNALAVTGSASPLSVNTGAAIVYGKLYTNSAAVSLAVTTPVVGTTGGHVILRLDWTLQTTVLVAVRNTDGVNSTPALTQSTSTQWEIRLASFTITTGGVITVTDARTYAQFATNHVKRDGDTMTGALALDPGGTTNAAIELGSTAGASTPFIDFHSSGNNIDYDSRLVASGGSGSIGQGMLNFIAAKLKHGGYAVMRVLGRVGASSTNWQSTGTTNYTPDNCNVQVGAGSVSISGTSASTTITFPVAFSDVPLPFASVRLASAGDSNTRKLMAYATATATQITINILTVDGSSMTDLVYFQWQAWGQ